MDLIADARYFNGRITTLNRAQPGLEALAVKAGVRILAAGRMAELQRHARPQTARIHLRRRRAMPGLNGGRMHLIRAGRHDLGSFRGAPRGVAMTAGDLAADCRFARQAARQRHMCGGPDGSLKADR